MRLLLDTCAVVFVCENSDRLSVKAKGQITHPEAEIFVSAISVAELACAEERGKLRLKGGWRNWWKQALTVNGWVCLPTSAEVFEEAYSLPQPIHADPGDRVIIATARLHGLTLVTTDQKILDYPHVQTIR